MGASGSMPTLWQSMLCGGKETDWDIAEYHKDMFFMCGEHQMEPGKTSQILFTAQAGNGMRTRFPVRPQIQNTNCR